MEVKVGGGVIVAEALSSFVFVPFETERVPLRLTERSSERLLLRVARVTVALKVSVSVKWVRDLVGFNDLDKLFSSDGVLDLD